MAWLVAKGAKTKFAQRIDWLTTVTNLNIGLVVLCFIVELVVNLVPKIRDHIASYYANMSVAILLSVLLILYVIFALLLILTCRKVKFDEFNVQELFIRLIVCSSLVVAFGVSSIGIIGSLAAAKTTSTGLGIAGAVLCVCWIIMISIVSWFTGRCRKRIANYMNVAAVSEHE